MAKARLCATALAARTREQGVSVWSCNGFVNLDGHGQHAPEARARTKQSTVQADRGGKQAIRRELMNILDVTLGRRRFHFASNVLRRDLREGFVPCAPIGDCRSADQKKSVHCGVSAFDLAGAVCRGQPLAECHPTAVASAHYRQ